MKNILISIGVAFLVVSIVYIFIIFFYPGMDIDSAFGLIVYSFAGSVTLTALVLRLRRHR